MTASTAVLGLTGTLMLAAPSLHASFGDGASGGSNFTHRLAMELTVIAVLIVSLVSSVMARRYYNHARFVGGMPVGSGARRRWAAAGTTCVRKAGVLYSGGLRQRILILPMVAFILDPLPGLVGALGVVAARLSLDRFRPGCGVRSGVRE